MKLQKEKEINY